MDINGNVLQLHIIGYLFYEVTFHLRQLHPVGYVNTIKSTQPPTLSGTINEHRPKCGGALRLESKGTYGSFHL